MSDQTRRDDPQENEGEGSRSAARNYTEGVERTVGKHHYAKDAERAKRDVEANAEEYRRAEAEGLSRSAGEAPGDME